MCTSSSITEYLFKHAKDDSPYLPLSEEALRFSEGQFVVWERTPIPTGSRPACWSSAGMVVYCTAYQAMGKETTPD
ncbi:hypothetical protein HRbin36_01755 [bacterium HR36]|nr:hypothetical protein HRbin36_01755 [bacterium HR36]